MLLIIDQVKIIEKNTKVDNSWHIYQAQLGYEKRIKEPRKEIKSLKADHSD